MTAQRASFMRRTVTVLMAVAVLAGIIAVTALPASAKVRGSNGRIVFGRFDPAVGDFRIFTLNPDGTDEVQMLIRRFLLVQTSSIRLRLLGAGFGVSL